MAKRNVIGKQVVFTCKVSQGGTVLVEELKHTLDFAGVTEQELMDLAAKSLVIDLQSDWRKCSDGGASEHGKTTSVREYLDRPITRGATDPVEALLKKADKGDVDLAEVIAKLQAKLTK